MSVTFADRADRSRVEQLLIEFVGIPSVNPGIDGGPGEAALASAVVAELQRLGHTPTRQQVAGGGRDNILARLEGAPGSPVVMLHAHLDTVGFSGTATAEVRLADGLVYGRGACDTKGSLVAMLEALRLLEAVDARERATVVFVGGIDEEVTGTGAEKLVTGGFGFDMAVVGEPTSLEMATAHKGVLRFEIATHGVPAHSSKPHLGVNAIYAMTPVLDALANRYVPSLGAESHPLVGSPTLSVSTIRGGTAENIVPAECVISIDRRVVPGESHDALLAEFDALLEGLAAPGVTIERRDPFLATAAVDTPAEHPLVAAIGRGREFILGERGVPRGMTFGTDGSFFDPAGIPCVVFGPGSIDQAHSDEEWVSVEETARGAEILAEAMLALA
jgi:acetylornithine deacetylase